MTLIPPGAQPVPGVPPVTPAVPPGRPAALAAQPGGPAPAPPAVALSTPGPPRRGLPRGILVMSVIVVVLALAAAGALWWGQRDKGEATEKEPPRTATIERTSLVASTTLSGNLGFGDATELGGGGGMVTKLPEAGAVVEVGQVLMEAVGRPVFLLRGDVPLWRQVQPDTVGPDVAAVRGALADLGIDAGVAGETTFDAALSKAIGELYERAGYDPPAALTGQDETRIEAETAVETAKTALNEAEKAVSTARVTLGLARHPPVTRVEKITANQAVASAQRALKKTTKTGVDAAAVKLAEEALAVAVAARVAFYAPPDTTAQQDGVDAATTDLAKAKATLDALTDPDERKPAQLEVDAAASALAQAQLALNRARNPAIDEAARLGVENGVIDAQRTLATARKGDGGAAYKEAKAALKLAKIQLQELSQPKDATAEKAAVADAKETVATARATLTKAEEVLALKDLNTVSSKDVLMVPAGTIRVDQVLAKIGQEATTAVIKWTATTLYAQADVTDAQRNWINTGRDAVIELRDGSQVSGKVAEITEPHRDPTTQETTPARVRIEIEDQAALQAVGPSGVTISFVEGEAADTLVVPVTALTALAEGGYAVTLTDGTRIGVELGLVADARAQISSDQLSEGQEVVVP